MFSLICVWINGWVNNREAGDLKRYRAHYGVTVMIKLYEAYDILLNGQWHTYDIWRIEMPQSLPNGWLYLMQIDWPF